MVWSLAIDLASEMVDPSVFGVVIIGILTVSGITLDALSQLVGNGQAFGFFTPSSTQERREDFLFFPQDGDRDEDEIMKASALAAIYKTYSMCGCNKIFGQRAVEALESDHKRCTKGCTFLQYLVDGRWKTYFSPFF